MSQDPAKTGRHECSSSKSCAAAPELASSFLEPPSQKLPALPDESGGYDLGAVRDGSSVGGNASAHAPTRPSVS